MSDLHCGIDSHCAGDKTLVSSGSAAAAEPSDCRRSPLVDEVTIGFASAAVFQHAAELQCTPHTSEGTVLTSCHFGSRDWHPLLSSVLLILCLVLLVVTLRRRYCHGKNLVTLFQAPTVDLSMAIYPHSLTPLTKITQGPTRLGMRLWSNPPTTSE